MCNSEVKRSSPNYKSRVYNEREREREIRINLSDRQHSDQSVENSNTSNIKERAR